jgi:hypothetical protein
MRRRFPLLSVLADEIEPYGSARTGGVDMIRIVTRTLAVAATAGAVAAPAASAMLPPPDPPASREPTQPVVIDQPRASGFDYGDAAIGAGLALTVVVAGTGGAVALHRARRPQISPGA